MYFMSRIYMNYEDIIKNEPVVIDFLTKKIHLLFSYYRNKKTLFTITTCL